MSKKKNKAELSDRVKRGETQRLRQIQQRARAGERLNPPLHLRAALALGQAYREVRPKMRGGRDAFENRALETLDLLRGKPDTFNIAKFTLPKCIMKVNEDVRRKYESKKLPQKGLAHYLAAIRVVAMEEGQNVDSRQIAFLKEIGLWMEDRRTDAGDEIWDSVEELAELLRLLSTVIANEAGLLDAFRQQDRLPLFWSFLDDTLRAKRNSQFNVSFSPIFPEVELGVNIYEVRPFPSIPLIRVPLGWSDTEVQVEMGNACVSEVPGTERPDGRWERRKARLVQYRDVRLALAPLENRKVGPVLMSRGLVGLDFPGSTSRPVWGTLHWSDRLNVQQEINLEGGWRRVRLPDLEALDHVAPGDPTGETGDWDWEYDPVEQPGSFTGLGADYVSFTRMTVDHLHHWLVVSHELAGVQSWCPWDAVQIPLTALEEPGVRDWIDRSGSDDLFDIYWDGISEHSLACPDGSAARSIECCLYNGLIKNALETVAHRISEETSRVVSEIRSGAEASREALRAQLTARSLKRVDDKG